MSSAKSSVPFDRATVIRTTNPEEMRDKLLSIYGASSFSLSGSEGFDGRCNNLQLTNVAIGFCSYGVPTTVEFPGNDFVRLQLALRGSGQTLIGQDAIAIDQSRLCVTSPGQASTVRFGADYQQLIMRVSEPVLEHTLSSLLGARPRGRISFESAVRADQPGAPTLLNLLGFLTQQLDDPANSVPPLVLRELEQALVVAFLCATRHNFSAQLEGDPGDATPWHVRMAEEYIEAIWDKPISIDDLAAHTQIGARMLFKAFKRTRGYSPMAFARSVRLRKANAMLLQGDPQRGVTSVALACGFGNIGHFARNYREMFGELPSATFARARRNR